MTRYSLVPGVILGTVMVTIVEGLRYALSCTNMMVNCYVHGMDKTKGPGLYLDCGVRFR